MASFKESHPPSPHHAVEQRLEIIHMLIDHAVTVQRREQLLCAGDLCLLDGAELERGERPLRLRDEVDVPLIPHPVSSATMVCGISHAVSVCLGYR